MQFEISQVNERPSIDEGGSNLYFRIKYQFFEFMPILGYYLPKEKTFSTDNTILFETQIVHRLVNRFLDLLPVRPALDKFVYVLVKFSSSGWSDWYNTKETYFRAICASIPRDIPHDLREIPRILDNIDVPKHLEVGEFGCNLGHLWRGNELVWEFNKGETANFERSYEHVVGIQICDDLKPTTQRYDLSLDMLVQNPIFKAKKPPVKLVSHFNEGLTYPMSRRPTS
jgi:hypothetical protein